jgi:hypothetical protein
VIVFDLAEHSNDGAHTFAVYDCRPQEEGGVVATLAKTIRDLYVDRDRLREVLTAAMNAAGAVADVGPLEEAIQRTLTAAIPEPGTHPIPHLDVARNELAEAIAHMALPDLYGTVIPAPRIRNKEVPNQPARGRDLLGLDVAPLTAVIGEVKASDEAHSPPGVVGVGDNSLRGQFENFLASKDALLTELNWALKHAGPEHKDLLARAILTHVAGVLPVCAAPVLIRPTARHGADDFGIFKNNPGQFAPACVRFSIFRVDGTLDELAQAVYDEARR